MRLFRRKMNVKLLRRIQEEILKDPRRFDMGTWFDTSGSQGAPCGTTACIGGWAVAIGSAKEIGPMPLREMAAKYGRNRGMLLGEVAKKATKVLHLSTAQSARLFYVQHWPDGLRDAYHCAASLTEKAKIAAERIDRFIETKGEK